jgi:hypothetical protein
LATFKVKSWSRVSSVGIALGYGPDDRGSRVRFPAGAGNFSLHHLHSPNVPSRRGAQLRKAQGQFCPYLYGNWMDCYIAHKIYEEESKSNLNMAIKSQNHVVDGCTTDMVCPPA